MYELMNMYSVNVNYGYMMKESRVVIMRKQKCEGMTMWRMEDGASVEEGVKDGNIKA
jgi:hypothetical protein